MKYVISGEVAANVDEITIKSYGIPSMVLMERAALSVCHEVFKYNIFNEYKDNVVIIAGTGNNGADGLAIARILNEEGIIPKVYVIGNPEKCSVEFRIQQEILSKIDIDICWVNSRDDLRITSKCFIFDCIFGIGLKRDISGVYREVIDIINETEGFVLSVDIPSGISANNGCVLGCAVKADVTVTFGYEKTGLYLCHGRDYSGNVINKNIGFIHTAIDTIKEKTSDGILFALEDKDINRIPKRQNSSNKGTYGNVVIIAGSRNMSGAAYLSGEAAYRCGAGIVKLFSHNNNLCLLKEKLPEAIVADYEDVSFSEKDIIVIGPGLSTDDMAVKLIDKVLNSHNRIVIDADGLNVISSHRELMDKLNDNVIITPHIKEMSRLTGYDTKYIKENIISTSREFAKKYKCVTVIKDSTTVISDSFGNTYINLTGNSGMSTGGSGDVLSGVVGGMLSQGLSGGLAAAIAVYIHGLAGDIAKEDKTMYGLMASDISGAIPKVFKMLNKYS